MPAPDHLIPLLTALGDGGTVATADAVVAAAGGLPGQVTAPALDVVLAALGDGGTRDVAGRVVSLYEFAAPVSAVMAHTAALTRGFTAAGPGEAVITVSGPVVNETVEPVTPDLAEAIAATDPDAPEADASGGEDSDEDEWEASGLDEFAVPAETPAPEPVVNEPVGDHVPAATVRAWAKASGVKVPARGAIPQDVRDAYNAAQGAWRPGQTTSAIASEA